MPMNLFTTAENQLLQILKTLIKGNFGKLLYIFVK